MHGKRGHRRRSKRLPPILFWLYSFLISAFCLSILSAFLLASSRASLILLSMIIFCSFSSLLSMVVKDLICCRVTCSRYPMEMTSSMANTSSNRFFRMASSVLAPAYSGICTRNIGHGDMLLVLVSKDMSGRARARSRCEIYVNWIHRRIAVVHTDNRMNKLCILPVS